MVAINGQNQNGIDFSIMPSLECNLKCSFCMYNSSPENKQQIDLKKLVKFLNTIPNKIINSFGLYGGEPSINILLYGKVINLLPENILKFTITNGTWTKPYNDKFPAFIKKYNLQCFISSTPEHKVFQDPFIIKVASKSLEFYTIKDDDTQGTLLPMGRNKQGEWHCTKKCLRDKNPQRFAAKPNGDIIFQSCDGIFPVVGNINNPFNLEAYSKQITNCKETNG